MIYTDDELSEIEGFEDEDEDAPLMAPPGAMGAPPPSGAPIQLYPLSLAQLGQQQPAEAGVLGFAKKKVGPLPVWAWGLCLGAAGTGAWWLLKKRKSSDSEDSSGERMTPNPGDGEESAGWSPSRSGFGSQLQRFFDKAGKSASVVVWHDAEDAQRKGKMKFVSPLINVQVKDKSVTADAALQKFCRREGLNPVAHDDGSIGLYPHTGKRGKAWEDYVDALRDDGQQV